MKENRGKPIGVTIHRHLEISQGNSYVATCFLLRNQRTEAKNRREEQVLPRGRGFGTSGRGEVAGKRV
jgi:hypothetical protein